MLVSDDLKKRMRVRACARPVGKTNPYGVSEYRTPVGKYGNDHGNGAPQRKERAPRSRTTKNTGTPPAKGVARSRTQTNERTPTPKNKSRERQTFPPRCGDFARYCPLQISVKQTSPLAPLSRHGTPKRDDAPHATFPRRNDFSRVRSPESQRTRKISSAFRFLLFPIQPKNAQNLSRRERTGDGMDFF